MDQPLAPVRRIVAVNCEGCHACCKNQLVLLEPADDPAAYECDVIERENGSQRALKHQPNGDCFYLGPEGCTIHGRQPAICRSFSCLVLAAEWPRAARRAKNIPKGWEEVLKAGQRRLREQEQVMTRLAREHRSTGETKHVRQPGSSIGTNTPATRR